MIVSVLMLVGSPRKGGNTDRLMDKVAEGVAAAGAAVDKVYLNDLVIGPCDACNECRHDGRCKKDDGMQALYAKMRECRAMVIGTPVYWWGPSGQTKTFVDRWYAFDERREVFSGKPFALVTTSGAGSPQMASHVLGMFRSIASYLDMPLVGMEWAAGQPLGRIQVTGPAMQRMYDLGQRVGEAVKPARSPGR